MLLNSVLQKSHETGATAVLVTYNGQADNHITLRLVGMEF